MEEVKTIIVLNRPVNVDVDLGGYVIGAPKYGLSLVCNKVDSPVENFIARQWSDNRRKSFFIFILGDHRKWTACTMDQGGDIGVRDERRCTSRIFHVQVNDHRFADLGWIKTHAYYREIGSVADHIRPGLKKAHHNEQAAEYRYPIKSLDRCGLYLLAAAFILDVSAVVHPTLGFKVRFGLFLCTLFLGLTGMNLLP